MKEGTGIEGALLGVGGTTLTLGPGAGGQKSATGLYGAYFGVNAGLSLTTGEGNTFIGCAVGKYCTTGAYNVGLGDGALMGASGAEVTGSYNTAIGSHAMYGSATGATGGHNTAIGNTAGAVLTTASNNTLLGSGAGYSLTTGASNVALGFQAGYSCVTGTLNIFIGMQAGYAETGSQTLYLGYDSGTSDYVYMYGTMASSPRLWRLNSYVASAGTTLRDGPTISTRAHYWNGSANVAWDFSVVHTMVATTPQSTVFFKINNVTALDLNNTNGTVSALIPLEQLLYFYDRGGEYILGDGTGLQIVTSGGNAMYLAADIQCQKKLRLLVTDTDGTVEGQLWYDASEDKLKFKTAAGVETITSA